MIRGTTPKLEFTIPFDAGQLAEAYITISQKGGIVIDKPLSEIICDGNVMSLHLTQEETLKLKADSIAEIQIRVRTNSGEALASNIIQVSTERILKDGEI